MQDRLVPSHQQPYCGKFLRFTLIHDQFEFALVSFPSKSYAGPPLHKFSSVPQTKSIQAQNFFDMWAPITFRLHSQCNYRQGILVLKTLSVLYRHSIPMGNAIDLQGFDIFDQNPRHLRYNHRRYMVSIIVNCLSSSTFELLEIGPLTFWCERNCFIHGEYLCNLPQISAHLRKAELSIKVKVHV